MVKVEPTQSLKKGRLQQDLDHYVNFIIFTMTQLKETQTEELVPQSTRLLQDLLMLRAKVDLQEDALKALRSENEQLNRDLNKSREQMEEAEESSTKAFGLLGHELELARAMAAHIKKEAAEQVLKHETEMQETVARFTQEIAQLKKHVTN